MRGGARNGARRIRHRAPRAQERAQLEEVNEEDLLAADELRGDVVERVPACSIVVVVYVLVLIKAHRANPVLFNDSLESSVLPRTRYHLSESVELSTVRLTNAWERRSTDRSLIECSGALLYRSLA